MIYKIIIFLVVLIIFNGCFHVSSRTEMKITKISQLEYNEIKKDIKDNVMSLNPPLDCDSFQASKRYQKNNELVCDYGSLYTETDKSNLSIVYSGGTEFWIPTNEIITEQHKNIQKLFLDLASKYQKKYNKDVKVIFYHHDLPPDGRILF